MIATTTGTSATSSSTVYLPGRHRHVVDTWKRARGSNQHWTRYVARCVDCGQKITREDRREGTR